MQTSNEEHKTDMERVSSSTASEAIGEARFLVYIYPNFKTIETIPKTYSISFKHITSIVYYQQ